MANPSISIDIENPSTVYTLPPPPKYSEIYQNSNAAPNLNIPSPNNPSENRQSVLIGPSEIRPNLAASAGTTRNATSYYESGAARRRFHDAVFVRCCFTIPFFIAFIVIAIIKIVNS